MDTAKFRISTEGVHTTVEINGKDVSNLVQRATVDMRAGVVPTLYLEGPGIGELAGEGIVHAVKDLDPQQVIINWLEQLDPAALEAQALNSLEGGLAGATTGELFLAALKKVAGSGH